MTEARTRMTEAAEMPVIQVSSLMRHASFGFRHS